MNVLHLSQWLSVAIFVLYPGDVAGQFTAASPTCPGDTFTFRCNVTGDMSGETTWRVDGSSQCILVHTFTSSPICGPSDVFRARSGTGFGMIGATLFSSTLSGTAFPTLNDTLVECFGPANNVDPGNRVGSNTLQILGPPSIPFLSCVGLSEGVSGAVNVTVSWTLSGGDSADFYLINITTSAPQTPYGGLLNITNANVTQYELTSFIAGYEYNITVHGVNCGNQEGKESQTLTITSQAPPAPSGCNITLLYRSQSSGRLLFINSIWDSIPDSVDPNPREECLGPSGDITQYKISFQTGSVVVTESVNIAMCTAGRCSHTFVPPSNPPSSYDSVSVAAENVVGVGTARTCTTQLIGTTNSILSEKVVNVSSPSDVRLICTFLSGFTGTAHCIVQYGTDPTYMNLPYSAESTETGTAGEAVSVVLRERLNSLTEYYYTVSAVSGDYTVTIQGNFTTPQYNCSVLELWNLSAADAGFQPDVNLLDDAAQYPTCGTDSVGSAVLENTTLNTATVAYYNGTTRGSKACFVCDESSGYELNTNINERVCQSDGTWSRSPTICICTMHQHLLNWHKTLIAIGAFFLVVGGVVAVLIIVYKCLNKVKWWQIPFVIVVVTGAAFSVSGVVLLIAMGTVVANPPNGNVCEPSWQQSRVGLITSQFAFSILVIVLGIILPLIMIIARKLYRQFHTKVPGGQPNAGEEPRFPPAPSTSDGNVQRNPQTDSGTYTSNGATTSSSQQTESSKLQQSENRGNSLSCPFQTNAAPTPDSHTLTEHTPGTNAEVAREEETRHGVLFMAVRQGDLATVNSFVSKRPDLITIKDNQGMTLLHVAAEDNIDAVKYLVKKGANKNIRNQSRRTPLHIAAKGGHCDIVKYLVEEGANVNIKDQLGKTPLHLAAGQGHIDVVKCLVVQGADISAKDMDGGMPQYVAAEEGHTDIVKYFVEQGAIVNITDRTGWTPLHVAAYKGHLRTVECLLEKQAGIYIKDRFGYTPLCVAVESGHEDIVECLLKKGDKVNIKDDEGPTSLRIAARQGHVNIVNLLVVKGADMSSKDDQGRTPLHIAVEEDKIDTVGCLVNKRADINIKDNGGRTPLHIAVKEGYEHIVKYLVEKGANVNIQDKKKWTPLHVAADEGYYDVVKYLVADKQADIHIKAYNGRIALHVAVEGGHLDIVKFFVDGTPRDIETKDNDGMTPLHVAAESGRFEIVDSGYLVGKKTDINVKDNSERTPLHIAVKEGYEHTVKSLVEKGADVNIPDNKGMTPLHVAVEKGGRSNIMELLLISKADINAKDNDERTPLHIAAKEGRFDTLKCLVGKGAQTNIKDKKGRTPLEVAIERKRQDIARFLTDASGIQTAREN